MSSLAWVAVAALGGLAAVARFALDTFVSGRTSGRLPLGTLAVNLSGTLLVGLVLGAALHGDAFTLADTAALGSFTTFSTWMLESHRLGEDDQLMRLALNLVLSLVAGLLALTAGHAIGAAL